MSLVLAYDDNHCLSHKRISTEPILVDHCLACVSFHVLRAHDEHIFAILHKDTVWLHEIFVVKEQIVAITMSDGATHSFVRSIFHLYHWIKDQRVSLTVSSRKSPASSRRVDLFSNVFELDHLDLVLLTDDLYVVLLYLKHVSCVLITIVIYKVSSFDPMILTSGCHLISGHWLVCIRFEFELVCQNLYHLLSLVQDYWHSFVFLDIQYLPSISFVFSFSDSY